MKTLLTTTLLLIALYTNAQVKMIETDSLHNNGLEMKKPYVFYYTDKYINFGEKEEDREDYTFMTLTSKNQRVLLGRVYNVYTTTGDYTIFIREDEKEIMFIGDKGSFVFY